MEHKFSFKKLLSLFLVCAMLLSSFTFLAFAEEEVTNVALGKSYTASQLFRQGGKDVGWGWDANAAIAYPDEDGKTMTDGVIAATDAEYSDAVWAGWNHNAPDYKEIGYSWITIDLGAATEITEADIWLGSSGLGSGIGCANMEVQVAISNDGQAFEVVGTAIPADDANSSSIKTAIAFESAQTAQFVQFRMIRGGWMFVSELEVYGVAPETEEPEEPAKDKLSIEFSETDTILGKTTEQAIELLTDGDWVFNAGAWGTGTENTVLFQNLNCTHPNGYGQINLIYEFAETPEAYNTIRFGLYTDVNSMIGCPSEEDVYFSNDGVEWVSGYYDLGYGETIPDAVYGGDNQTAPGTVVAEIRLENPQNYKFVKVEFYFPKSPFAEKVRWEFFGLTEAFEFDYVEPSSVITDFNATEYWESRYGRGAGSFAFTTAADYKVAWDNFITSNYTQVAFAPVEGVENTYEVVVKGNSELTFPEGGFIWTAYNEAEAGSAAKAALDLFATMNVGDQYTFNGIDFEKGFGEKDASVVKYEAPAEPEVPADPYAGKLTVTLSDNDAILGGTSLEDVAGILTDGDFALNAEAWGGNTNGVVVFQNMNPTDINADGKITLIWEFDETPEPYNNIKFGLYSDVNVMIGHPSEEDVWFSNDGVTWVAGYSNIGYGESFVTAYATFEENATKPGTIIGEVKLRTPQTYKFVKTEFYFPKSPFTEANGYTAETAKPRWEFFGLTEAFSFEYEEVSTFVPDFNPGEYYASRSGWHGTYIYNNAAAYALAEFNGGDGIDDFKHVAFAPVEGVEGRYEVVGVRSGNDSDEAYLAFPEGGFIWVARTGATSGTVGRKAAEHLNGMNVGHVYDFVGFDIEGEFVANDATYTRVFDTTLENIALGSSYTTDIVPSGSYPDEDGITLTDGKYLTHKQLIDSPLASYKEACWFSLNCTTADRDAAIDLALGDGESLYDLSKVVLYTGGDRIGSGIAEMKKIEVFYTVDGETYEKFGEYNYQGTPNTYLAECIIEGETVTASDIRVICYPQDGKNMVFLSELEAYGVKAEIPDEPDEPEVPEEPEMFWAEGEYDVSEADGNITPHHAWGYVFTLDTINSLDGNTTALFTDAAAYANVGKWSSKAVFAPTEEENVYVLVAAYKITSQKGQADIDTGIVDFSKGQIVLVAQDSGTRPEKLEDGTLRFPNWEERAAIWGLVNTPGAKVTLAGIDLAAGTMENGTVTVEAKPEDDVVMEEITVDGDLSDNGWKANGWTEVYDYNGYWQALPTTEDTLSYKYQFRTDDTKLYAALVIDCALVEGGNGAGTNVRFWINTNDEATVYTHFYDVFVKEGAVAYNAKYNTELATNKAANIENSSISGAVVTEDGVTYVEFSIDLAEFNGTEGFDYFICVSNKVNENLCLYYPAVEEGESSRLDNLPYKAWYTAGEATVDVEEIKLGEIVPPVEVEINAGENEITIPATNSAIATTNFDTNYIILIQGQWSVSVKVNGIEYWPNRMGNLEAKLPAGENTVEFVNSSDEEVTFVATVTAPIVGDTPDDPIILEEAGKHTATVDANYSMGVYYTYYATVDGTLTIKMITESGWTYVINNLNTYKYGDTHWFDDDPIVAFETIEVNEGDEIQIIVSTYDPSNPWGITEGSVEFEITEEEVLPTTSQVVTDFNPATWQDAIGGANGAFIYDDADIYAACKNDWWIHVAFAPVADMEGYYEVIAVRQPTTGEFLAIPEGGFIWMAWSSAGDTPESAGAYALAFMNKLNAGDIVKFVGVDFANHTTEADAYAEIWVDPNAPENVALGKDYEISGCGNRGSYYGSITDGNAVMNLNSNNNENWFGFYNNGSDQSVINAPNGVGYFIIDLEAFYNINKVKVGIIGQPSWGIANPGAIKAYASNDGVEFVEIGEFDVTLATAGVGEWKSIEATDCVARYIKIEVTLAGTFAFVNEVEVYGTEADEPTQPDVPVDPKPELPEGAIILDYAGYVHDSYFEIVAGDNMTVADLTTLGIGSAKDMNYFYVVVVDANNVVVETYFTLGRPDGVKSDVVCPEGGYIIALNANKAGADAILVAKVGDTIELYNIDVDSFRGAEGSVALENAGFAIIPGTEPPVEPKPEISGWGAGVEVMTDGYTGLGEITGWENNDTKIYGFSNNLLVGAEYEFVIAIDEAKFDGIVLYALDYANGGVMLPEAVTFVVNGVEYAAVITPNENGIATITAEFEAVTASEITVKVVMGASPYEFGIFNMFTEIEVTEYDEPIVPPVDDAVLGDVNDDGNIDAYDYILVKRQIMGTIELTDDQLAVSDIDGDEDVDMYDYILIKRHILGTYVIG